MDKPIEACKVDDALEIIVGKWKPKILLLLLEHKTMRFNELRRHLPGITQKMLTQQLRDLEEEYIVHRKVYAQVPPKVEYSITEYGLSLDPILDTIHQWGSAHLLFKAKKIAQKVATESLPVK